MKRIAIVEDDENIRELVIYALKTSGFDAVGYETGGDFFNALRTGPAPPDLALLDIMLPGDDGLVILKKLRQNAKHGGMPVIMLTSKGGEYDKVRGLDAGADDYVAKPFGVTELISRVNAVLRRSGKNTGDVKLNRGAISIDEQKREATADGAKLRLTYKEYELLKYFLTNAGIVLSRDTITDAVWGYGFEGGTRTVDMHVKTLRRKLGAAGAQIETVRNVGYTLKERPE